MTVGSTDPAHNGRYQRATDPERYQVLHDVAHRLLHELEQQYAVTRSSHNYDDAHAPMPKGCLMSSGSLLSSQTRGRSR